VFLEGCQSKGLEVNFTERECSEAFDEDFKGFCVFCQRLIYEQKLPISHSIDEGAKRKYKEKVYKKNGFKLINLENDDLLNLNDRLNHELGKL
jgi:hypothetical protein